MHEVRSCSPTRWWGKPERVLRDIVQQSFLHAWHHASQFDSSEGTLATWLLGIGCPKPRIDEPAQPRIASRATPGGDTASTSDVWREVTRKHRGGYRPACTQRVAAYRSVIELALFGATATARLLIGSGPPPGTYQGSHASPVTPGGFRGGTVPRRTA